MKESLMNKIKYELLGLISDNGLTYSDKSDSVGTRHRHSIVAYYQHLTMFIVRNYNGDRARLQSIVALDLDDVKIFEKFLSGDATICDQVAEAIKAMKQYCDEY